MGKISFILGKAPKTTLKFTKMTNHEQWTLNIPYLLVFVGREFLETCNIISLLYSNWNDLHCIDIGLFRHKYENTNSFKGD